MPDIRKIKKTFIFQKGVSNFNFNFDTPFLFEQPPLFHCYRGDMYHSNKDIMENFEELIASETPVLVDFYATWCGPCRTMHPILEELKELKGNKLRIVKIDVDKHEELATKERIQSIPTLMLYWKGQLLWRQSGVVTITQLKEIIEKHV